jgi:hypothetical protein
MIRANRELCVHFKSEAVCADWRNIASLTMSAASKDVFEHTCVCTHGRAPFRSRSGFARFQPGLALNRQGQELSPTHPSLRLITAIKILCIRHCLWNHYAHNGRGRCGHSAPPTRRKFAPCRSVVTLPNPRPFVEKSSRVKRQRCPNTVSKHGGHLAEKTIEYPLSGHLDHAK